MDNRQGLQPQVLPAIFKAHNGLPVILVSRKPVSAPFFSPRCLSRSVAWSFLALMFICEGMALAQDTRHSPNSRSAAPAAHARVDQQPELKDRFQALETAKQTGDPANVSKAAKLLIAAALRRMGETELLSHSAEQASERFRRSLDFEYCAQGRFALAVSYLNSNRSDDALSVVTELLTADLQNARAWYLQGRVWRSKKLYDQAIESFKRSITLEPTPLASYWLGAALLQTQQRGQARTIFEKLLAQVGNRAQLHMMFAEAYGTAGYSDDAATERKLASQLDPQLRNAQDRLAEDLDLTLDDDNPWGAIRSARKISAEQLQQQQAELRKLIASGLNDLGTAEARQQQFSLALAHFHEAETSQPDTPGLQRNIGIAAMRASDYKEAARALRPVVAANPQDNVAREALGSALFATNAFADAAKTLTPLGDSILEHPDLAYELASSLIKINKYPEATVLLTKLEATALSPQMQLLVAQAWSQMAVYPRTVQACHRALEADPRLRTAHYLAGLALIRQDRAVEATQEFRDELQLDPDNIDAQYNLAFVLLQQSRGEEALRLLRGVLAQNPNHPEANYELGKQLFSSGNASDAIPYLEAAARLKPAFEPVHYQLQAAYRAVGRKEDADREAKVYRDLKAKSRNITLPPPREQGDASAHPD
jgi:tetratricopeptide (TPR) repeat protein